MANQIYIPILLPDRFVEIDPVQLPQYLTKHFDDYWDSEQRQSFETPVFYKAKWQTSDTIYYQFESNFAAINLKLIDCDQNVIIDQNSVQVRANINMPGFYVYENTLSMASVPPGTYWRKLTLGDGTTTMISEPMEVAETWPGTILYEYKNSTFHGDVIFETGIQFGIRVEAFITRLDPANLRTAFRDQKQNPTILKSVPYREWKNIIGKKSPNGQVSGVPDWVIDKLNWVWSCDSVSLDGKSFAVADGANFEEQEVDKVYPFRSWVLKIQEGFNQYSKIVNPVIDPNKRLIVAGMIDSTLFGDLSENAGSNLVPVENVN